MNKRKTLNFILLVIFLISNWLLDLSTLPKGRLTNGLFVITNFVLLGHIVWYLSILIGVIFAYQLLVMVDK